KPHIVPGDRRSAKGRVEPSHRRGDRAPLPLAELFRRQGCAGANAVITSVPWRELHFERAVDRGQSGLDCNDLALESVASDVPPQESVVARLGLKRDGLGEDSLTYDLDRHGADVGAAVDEDALVLVRDHAEAACQAHCPIDLLRLEGAIYEEVTADHIVAVAVT